jgi:hypothetical protein
VAPRPSLNATQEPTVLNDIINNIPTTIHTVPEETRDVEHTKSNADDVPMVETHAVNISKANKRNVRVGRASRKTTRPRTKTIPPMTLPVVAVLALAVVVPAVARPVLVLVLVHPVPTIAAVRLVLLRVRAMTRKQKHMVENYTCQRLTKNQPRKLQICRAK